MQNIHELIGLIKGISFDGVINGMEFDELQSWIVKNRNLAYDVHQRRLINMLEDILEDGIIDDDERYLMIKYANEYASGHEVLNSLLYELYGIIRGIVSDEIINEDEVRRLRQWLNDNDSTNATEEFKKLCKTVSKILENNIVAEEDQRQVIEEFRNILDRLSFDSKLCVLRNLAREKKSIGVELIDIIDDVNSIGYIHKSAQEILKRMLQSYAGITSDRKEDVFISLVLIALLKYNSNFYDNVKETYSELYGLYSEQRIEGTIRSVINRYKTGKRSTERTRIINTVLKNAIVPEYYLPAFFDFIFDIYKLNFECELPDNLKEEFEFIYDGLRDNIDTNSDELKLGVTRKTYKLIKSTKMLIFDGENEGLIKLSIIIVTLIDKVYWELPVQVINPYLKYGFDVWTKSLQKNKGNLHEKSNNTEFRSKWEPKFFLDGDNVCLLTPVHRIKSKYDYQNIYIEFSNERKIIYRDNDPDIRQIIGGYQIKQHCYVIDRPLVNLTYKVMCGDSVIYNSGNKLYRDIIVFDYEGNEIVNNSDYEGNIFVVVNEINDRLRKICIKNHYYIYGSIVKTGDVVVIGRHVLNFSTFVKPGVFGDIMDEVYIRSENKSLQVYKQMNTLAIECGDLVDKIQLEVNGKVYRLNDNDVKLFKRPGVKQYSITLYLEDYGIYSIKVKQLSNGKVVKRDLFEFAIDSSLSWDYNKTDNSYYVVISSDIMGDVEKTFRPESYTDMIFSFNFRDGQYFYDIPLEIDVYSIDGFPYKACDNPIWIGDINDQSWISIPTRISEKLLIKNPDGKPIESIDMTKLKNEKRAKIGSLLSFKNSFDYIDLFFIADNHVCNQIRCYNKCVADNNLTEFLFDPFTSELQCEVIYYGIGDVRVELKNGDESVFLNENPLISGECVTIKDIHSFEEYTISVIEKKKGLLTKSVQREIMTLDRTFVSWKDIVGRTFKFKRVYYDQLIRNEFVRKHRYFNNSYITFNEYDGELGYIAEVYVKLRNGKKIEYNEINPVMVEICSDNLNGEVELSLEKDGDGLYLDFENNSILDTTFDATAVDIFSYILDISEVINE